MKLKIKILLFLILNYGFIHSQETSIEEIYNLKGKVKTVRYDSYLSQKTANGFQRIEKGWEDSDKNDELIELNKFGKIIKISFYDKNSKLQRVHSYDYKNNKLIKSVEKYQKSRFLYDSENKLITIKVFDRAPNKITSANIDELDKKEKIIVKYEYEKYGKLKQKVSENFKNGSISITTYSYNKENLLEKEETTTNDYKEWYLFKYNTNGKIINKKWFDNEDGLLENEDNQYSNNELVYSVWENYSDGELEGKITYTYQNENEIEINEFDTIDKTKITWKYSYEYDSHNNWIKKVAYTFKGEYYVVNRKIEYYK